MREATEITLSVVLGLVFLASAIPKLRHPRGFILTVLEYQILPPSLGGWFARLVPPTEFLVALMLLSGTVVRLAAGMVAILTSSFIFAISINLARGRDLDCGCFGTANNRRIGPRLLLQDTVLLGASLVLIAVNGGSGSPSLERWSLYRLVGLPSASTPVAIAVCAGLTLVGSAIAGRLKMSGRRWRSSTANW